MPPLPTDSLAVAQVSLKDIAKQSDAYQRLWPKATVWGGDWKGLDFSAEGGILSNTWSANGAGACTSSGKSMLWPRKSSPAPLLRLTTASSSVSPYRGLAGSSARPSAASQVLPSTVFSGGSARRACS